MTDPIVISSMMLSTIVLVLLLMLQVARLQGEVNGVNSKLTMLMKHSGMSVFDVAVREAQALMREGKKIDAIKRYRELTGAGLAEAKAAVERTQEGARPA